MSAFDPLRTLGGRWLTARRASTRARDVFRASRIKSASALCWAVAFGLLLAMRLLTPQGFMPAWHGNQAQLILCDELGTHVGASIHHWHGEKDAPKHRQTCPYAAASAQLFLDPPATTIALQFAASSTVTPVHAFTGEPLKQPIRRPPSRAPPALA